MTYASHFLNQLEQLEYSKRWLTDQDAKANHDPNTSSVSVLECDDYGQVKESAGKCKQNRDFKVREYFRRVSNRREE